MWWCCFRTQCATSGSAGEADDYHAARTRALSQIANVQVTQDRYSIEHDGGQRLVSVTFNVGSGSLQRIVQEAQRNIAGSVVLPPHVFVAFTGAAEAEVKTATSCCCIRAGVGTLVMILFLSFHWRRIVGWSWPICLSAHRQCVGDRGDGLGISLGTAVGLVTVFGVSARNAILQLAHYEHLVEVEGATWNLDLVVRGANERLVPILMTAAVTGLGLARWPSGFTAGQESKDPWR